jgi:LacI family transcriptional regulator
MNGDLEERSSSGRPASRAGLKQVAERAGVGLSSVSRVLSGHPNVSAVMRHRVLDAATALGYEPDLLAQSLRRGATLTVGYVVGDISNPLTAQIALGAELALRRAGYSLLLLNSTNDPRLDAEHIRLLRQRRVDGLLLALADEGHQPTIEELLRCTAPFVLVDRNLSRLPEASSVHSDHRTGLSAAIEHLYQLGHRRIALVNGSTKVLPARERAATARRLARTLPGLQIAVRSGGFTAAHGQSATAALLRQPRRPTAIIAGSNQILPGVLRALRRAELSVPAEVSLVTCDDVALSEFLQPPLATVSRDLYAIGRTAAELLLERIAGVAPRRITLPTGFRPARSCLPVGGSDG